MPRFAVLLVGLFCSLVAAQADPLPRSPLLGLEPETTAAGAQVTVAEVLPDGSAGRLGLQAGDTLLSLNREAIRDFDHLLELVAASAVGEALSIEIRRGDETLLLQGEMQPRPRETSEIAQVIYGSVAHGDDLLRSIIHRPLTAPERAPAIFFIQGYTCASIDFGMLPEATTRQLVDQFVDAGYVVFRMEKPGVGDSRSARECNEIDFSAEAAAFLAGLRWLKASPHVDPSRVTLWGHSLGVLHAAVLANEEPVASVVGYGGAYKNWHDYMLDIYRVQAVKHLGTPPETAERNTETVAPFLAMWLKSDESWDSVLAAEATREAVEADLVPIDGDQVFGRHYTFFRDLTRYDFAALWHNLPAPVLMMHGSLDIQAIGDAWAGDVVAANRFDESLSRVIEGAEHAFMRYDDQAQYRGARDGGTYSPGRPGDRFDPRIGEETIRWLAMLQDR